jgi:hypothetical protein
MSFRDAGDEDHLPVQDEIAPGGGAKVSRSRDFSITTGDFLMTKRGLSPKIGEEAL